MECGLLLEMCNIVRFVCLSARHTGTQMLFVGRGQTRMVTRMSRIRWGVTLVQPGKYSGMICVEVAKRSSCHYHYCGNLLKYV